MTLTNNRGFYFGDALFETIRIYKGKILFWEDHYLRLMSSMRILRMEIPKEFTMEFLSEKILNATHPHQNARVRIDVFRKSGGLYTPEQNEVDYLISAKPLEEHLYPFSKKDYQADLFTDYHVPKGLLSNIKTNNKIIYVLAGIYAKENDFDNCILINTDKHLAEAVSGNLFLIEGNKLLTPRLEDGCLKGILRKKLLDFVRTAKKYEVKEMSLSPFELQRAEEVFITNAISGVIPVTHFRKKTFSVEKTQALLFEFKEHYTPSSMKPEF